MLHGTCYKPYTQRWCYKIWFGRRTKIRSLSQQMIPWDSNNDKLVLLFGAESETGHKNASWTAHPVQEWVKTDDRIRVIKYWDGMVEKRIASQRHSFPVPELSVWSFACSPFFFFLQKQIAPRCQTCAWWLVMDWCLMSHLVFEPSIGEEMKSAAGGFITVQHSTYTGVKTRFFRVFPFPLCKSKASAWTVSLWGV